MSTLIGISTNEKDGKHSYNLYFTEPLDNGEGDRAFSEWTNKTVQD